jgi:HK97 family phage prohead protease
MTNRSRRFPLYPEDWQVLRKVRITPKLAPRDPYPKLGETRDEFMSRCVETVLDDGTTADRDEAEASCELWWSQSQDEKKLRTAHGKSAGIEFVLSDATPDRMGDIVMVGGMDLAGFKKNPVALFSHQASFPIGKWRDLHVEGDKLIGKLVLAPTGTSDRIDEIIRLVAADVLRAVSIGFRSIETRPRDEGGLVFVKSELVETSLVAIPANPNALAVAKSLRISPATHALVFASSGTVKRAHGLTERLAAEVRFERARDVLVAACDRLAELKRADRQIACAVEVARHSPSGAAYRASPSVTPAGTRLRLLDAKSLGRQLRCQRERVAIAQIDLEQAYDDLAALDGRTRKR